MINLVRRREIKVAPMLHGAKVKGLWSGEIIRGGWHNQTDSFGGWQFLFLVIIIRPTEFKVYTQRF